MKAAYSMIALTIGGVGALYGAAAAQNERAFENVSVLRAQKIELVDAHGVTRARAGALSRAANPDKRRYTIGKTCPDQK